MPDDMVENPQRSNPNAVTVRFDVRAERHQIPQGRQKIHPTFGRRLDGPNGQGGGTEVLGAGPNNEQVTPVEIPVSGPTELIQQIGAEVGHVFDLGIGRYKDIKDKFPQYAAMLGTGSAAKVGGLAIGGVGIATKNVQLVEFGVAVATAGHLTSRVADHRVKHIEGVQGPDLDAQPAPARFLGHVSKTTCETFGLTAVFPGRVPESKVGIGALLLSSGVEDYAMLNALTTGRSEWWIAYGGAKATSLLIKKLDENFSKTGRVSASVNTGGMQGLVEIPIPPSKREEYRNKLQELRNLQQAEQIQRENAALGRRLAEQATQGVVPANNDLLTSAQRNDASRLTPEERVGLLVQDAQARQKIQAEQAFSNWRNDGRRYLTPAEFTQAVTTFNETNTIPNDLLQKVDSAKQQEVEIERRIAEADVAREAIAEQALRETGDPKIAQQILDGGPEKKFGWRDNLRHWFKNLKKPKSTWYDKIAADASIAESKNGGTIFTRGDAPTLLESDKQAPPTSEAFWHGSGEPVDYQKVRTMSDEEYQGFVFKANEVLTPNEMKELEGYRKKHGGQIPEYMVTRVHQKPITEGRTGEEAVIDTGAMPLDEDQFSIWRERAETKGIYTADQLREVESTYRKTGRVPNEVYWPVIPHKDEQREQSSIKNEEYNSKALEQLRNRVIDENEFRMRVLQDYPSAEATIAATALWKQSGRMPTGIEVKAYLERHRADVSDQVSKWDDKKQNLQQREVGVSNGQ